MVNLNDKTLVWQKASWELGTRIGHEFDKIKEWGALTFAEDIVPSAIVEVESQRVRIDIYDTKTYPQIEFPAPNIHAKISDGIKDTVANFGKLDFSFIIFDQNYEPFAIRKDWHSLWDYIGKNIEWKPLSFSTYSKWYEENSRKTSSALIWRIGQHVMRTTDIYAEKVLAAIVLGDYCDRFVPKQTGEVKVVSFEGFATLLIFLNQCLGGKRTIHTNQLKNLYEEFEKAKCIPLVPRKWRTDELNKMNTKRLDLVIKQLDEIVKSDKDEDDEEDSVKKDTKSSQEISKEDSTTTSGQDITINKLLEDAKKVIKEQINLAKTSKVSDKSFSEREPIKLSSIISGVSLLNSTIWTGEYFVDIDTNITESGISISEQEMLIAIISYGLMEILVEDTVSREICLELQGKMEEKYGVGIQFLYPTDERAKEMLEKGSEINAKNVA